MGTEITLTSIAEDACKHYYDGIPTFATLRKHYPSEYLPLIIIGAIVLVVNIVVSVRSWRKQLEFFEGDTFVPAFRSIMILVAFFLFPATSFVGMLSLRSSQFLHSIVNVYESICILAFYENMCGHLRLGQFLDGGKKVALRTGPCCCCLVCLKPAFATERTLSRLRVAMIVTILLQMLLQFGRTVRTFECTYDGGKNIMGIVINVLMLVAFLCAMYGLIAVFKSGQDTLRKYSYTAKFVAFKGMIFISKFLYMILSYVTVFSDSAIPSFYVDVKESDGIRKVLVIKNKARITIWTNFVSIMIGTLLLVLTHKFYSKVDYKPYTQKSYNYKSHDAELRNKDDIHEENI